MIGPACVWEAPPGEHGAGRAALSREPSVGAGAAAPCRTGPSFPETRGWRGGPVVRQCEVLHEEAPGGRGPLQLGRARGHLHLGDRISAGGPGWNQLFGSFFLLKNCIYLVLEREETEEEREKNTNRFPLAHAPAAHARAGDPGLGANPGPGLSARAGTSCILFLFFVFTRGPK